MCTYNARVNPGSIFLLHQNWDPILTLCLLCKTDKSQSIWFFHVWLQVHKRWKLIIRLRANKQTDPCVTPVYKRRRQRLVECYCHVACSFFKRVCVCLRERLFFVFFVLERERERERERKNEPYNFCVSSACWLSLKKNVIQIHVHCEEA